MYNNELYHWGKKGMKWGVRRYQNEDGTLTEAGKKRYARDQRENSGKKKGDKVGQADPDRWVREDLTRSRKLTEETGQLVGKLESANSRSMKNVRVQKMDLSSMTDKQMRDEINRALLERQYNEMFAPRKSTRGREYVGQVLETAGTVLGVGASALGIALAIKELKG